MPVENVILRHWQDELRAFHQNFSLLQEHLDPDPIHDLRVAIKKLRSYLKLYVALCHQEKVDEQFAKTRQLFSVLGKHRNIEITKTLLSSFTQKDNLDQRPVLLYLQLLHDQVLPFCKEAIEQYEMNELDAITSQIRHDLENAETDDLEANIKKIIASSVGNIKEHLKHFRKKSHLIRKRFKDIFYWSKMFDEEVFFGKQELKSLDKILDHLGNIQDHEVLIINLKNFRKTILPGNIPQTKVIKEIEKSKASKTKDALLEKAEKLTKDLVKQA